MIPRVPLVPVAPLVVSGLLIVAFLVRAVTDAGGPETRELFATHVYDLAKVLAVVVLVARVVRPGEQQRTAWALVAAGLGLSMVGDLMWDQLYEQGGVVPIPSISDVFYVGAYVPLALAAVAFLRGSRGAGRLHSGVWLDGLVAALAVAVVFAAVVLEPVRDSLRDESDRVVFMTQVAYPLADLLLLAVFVAGCAVRGWRIDLRWAGLVAGAATYVVADGVYLLRVLDETYVAGGVVDAGWLAAAWIWAAVAWRPATAPLAPDRPSRFAALAPVGFGTAAAAVLTAEALGRDSDVLTLSLGCATVLVVFARFAVTSAEHHRLLHASRRDAATDALTGLGNRRRLDAALADRGTARRALVIFDLDGFKLYNDTFGHPAGDQLLTMIGDALAEAVGETGTAFRMGGDEFCALVDPADEPAELVARRLSASLVQTGAGFHVGASYGAVTLPDETSCTEEAMRLADRRLYANKGTARASAHRQSSDVLLAALAERDPDLGAHVDHVARLAVDVAHRLELSASDVEDIRRAAALHDVGKIAIPDRILDKPGPLDPEELVLMRQHTIVGERVLSAAPALTGVATLVRSSHERWDGRGYPDGLAGEQIPLGSRVVFVCDAFDAMTTDRPYQSAMPVEDALEELRRCAGGQFDPRVVAAFEAAITAAPIPAAPPALI